MKCLIMNTCENKFLCCHFCNEKRCKARCYDKYKNCKYFEKEKIKITEEKEEDINK